MCDYVFLICNTVMPDSVDELRRRLRSKIRKLQSNRGGKEMSSSSSAEQKAMALAGDDPMLNKLVLDIMQNGTLPANSKLSHSESVSDDEEAPPNSPKGQKKIHEDLNKHITPNTHGPIYWSWLCPERSKLKSSRRNVPSASHSGNFCICNSRYCYRPVP